VTAPLPPWAACTVCSRVHRGPKCKPDDARSVRVCTTFPGFVYRLLVANVPWGERSRYVAELVERDLAGRS
jgi:hypothetical protein